MGSDLCFLSSDLISLDSVLFAEEYTLETDAFRYHGFRKIVLVDTENTMDLSTLFKFDFTKNDCIVFFTTVFSREMPRSINRFLLCCQAEIVNVECIRYGKNSLDIQLLMYMSSLLSKFDCDNLSVFIVSNDKGFSKFGIRIFDFLKCPNLILCQIGSEVKLFRSKYPNDKDKKVTQFKCFDSELDWWCFSRGEFIYEHSCIRFKLSIGDEVDYDTNTYFRFISGEVFNLSKEVTVIE